MSLRLLRHLLTALLATSLWGCTTLSPIANKNRPLLNASNGLALLSLGYVKDSERDAKHALTTSLIGIKLRRTDVTGQVDASVKNLSVGGRVDWDERAVVIETADQIRVLRGVELEPGTYEVFMYYLAVGLGPMTWGSNPNFEPPITFTVRANEITYIGSYEMRLTTGKNLFGQNVPARASLSVVNRLQEDRARLQEIRPEAVTVPTGAALDG